jgi:hypothetical protein
MSSYANASDNHDPKAVFRGHAQQGKTRHDEYYKYWLALTGRSSYFNKKSNMNTTLRSNRWRAMESTSLAS